MAGPNVRFVFDVKWERKDNKARWDEAAAISTRESIGNYLRSLPVDEAVKQQALTALARNARMRIYIWVEPGYTVELDNGERWEIALTMRT